MDAAPSLTPGLDNILSDIFSSLDNGVGLPSLAATSTNEPTVKRKRQRANPTIHPQDPQATGTGEVNKTVNATKRRKKKDPSTAGGENGTDPSVNTKQKKDAFHRRNIRKVISGNKVNEETRAAQLAESERLKRVAEREEQLKQQTDSMYDEHFSYLNSSQSAMPQLSSWYPPQISSELPGHNLFNGSSMPQSHQTYSDPAGVLPSNSYQLPSQLQSTGNHLQPYPNMSSVSTLPQPHHSSNGIWITPVSESPSFYSNGTYIAQPVAAPLMPISTQFAATTSSSSPSYPVTQTAPMPVVSSSSSMVTMKTEGASAATAIALSDSNEEDSEDEKEEEEESSDEDEDDDEDVQIDEQKTLFAALEAASKPTTTANRIAASPVSTLRTSQSRPAVKPLITTLLQRPSSAASFHSAARRPRPVHSSASFTSVKPQQSSELSSILDSDFSACPTLNSLLSSGPQAAKPPIISNPVKDESLYNEVIELSDDDEEDITPHPETNDLEETEKSIGNLLMDEPAAVRAAVLSECSKDRIHCVDINGTVVVNPSHPDSEPDIHLHPRLAPRLKPHQIGGIRFLYDNVIESLDQFQNSDGFGCILAHSMGLGKTVQVIGFLEVFFRVVPTAHSALLVVPINTLLNWQAEFDNWVPAMGGEVAVADGNQRLTITTTNGSTTTPAPGATTNKRPFRLFVLRENLRSIDARHKFIMEWYQQGGILLMGYEMFRLLVNRNVKKPTARNTHAASNSAATDGMKHSASTPVFIDVDAEDRIRTITNDFLTALCDPGPQIVICDEGHRIKNSEAGISKALKRIRTRRRVVLTGYPLQNNLLEYWCMVDFVRPNYLGTRPEFTNMFQRPIENGQCVDSDEKDRKLMQGRAHVLHELLNGFVLRRSHAVLKGSLPFSKQEFVICIRMSAWQRRLYAAFMRGLKGKRGGGGGSGGGGGGDSDEETSRSSSVTQIQNQNQGNPYLNGDKPDLSMAQTWELIYRGGNLNATPPVQPQSQSSTAGVTVDGGCNTLKTYAVCCKIWNHPDVLHRVLLDRRQQGELDLDLGDLLASLDTEETTASVDASGEKSSCGAGGGSGPPSRNSSRRGVAKPRTARGRNSGGGTLAKSRYSAVSASTTRLDDTASGDACPGFQEFFTEHCLGQQSASDVATLSSIDLDYHWAQSDQLWENYPPSRLENSGKFVILMALLEETIAVGDRMLVFSQSLMTLDLIESFLAQRPVPFSPRLANTLLDKDTPRKWVRNDNYFRLDGSTSSTERDRQINAFNPPDSPFELFLLSTRAGCLGINLVGANRVVMMDASWNPCHDCQAVCRVYRYGQQKPCHIYRLIADNTMEKKIYDRQVAKQGMADRVVDELNPNAHFTKQQVDVLLEYEEKDLGGLPQNAVQEVTEKCSDSVLSTVLLHHSDWITKKPFTHESLLIDRRDIRLTQREKLLAKQRYESDRFMARAGQRVVASAYQPNDPNIASRLLDPRFHSIVMSAAKQANSDRELQTILNYVNTLTKTKPVLPAPHSGMGSASHKWQHPPSSSSSSTSLPASHDRDATSAATHRLQMDLEEQKIALKKQRLGAFLREMSEAREREKLRKAGTLSASNSTTMSDSGTAQPGKPNPS